MNTGDETLARWAGEAIGALPAGELRIIGRGLWGPTIEVGDGSLLKLVRRSAGIGDGLDIHANEVRVLAALGGGPIEGVAVPRLIDHGEFMPDTAAASEGFAAWLRMTRVPGRPVGWGSLSAMSPSERVCLAESYGHSIAILQQEGTRIIGQRLADLEERVRALLGSLLAFCLDEADRGLCTALHTALDEVTAGRRRGFVHGDAHLENVMVDDDCRVCGFIDLAEGGRGIPEIDLAYLHWLPEIADPVRWSYEQIAGAVDEATFQLMGAIYALTSCVISRKHGESADADRAVLERCRGVLFRGN